MKTRVFIWIIAFCIAGGFFFKWYTSIPELLKIEPSTEFNNTISRISEKYIRYRSLDLLVYGTGQDPTINGKNITFSDGVWLLRSIDSAGSVSFSGPKDISGNIKGKGTIFLDFQNNIILSIDALVLEKDSTKILPSFYVKNNEKMFYDLGNIEKIVDTELWKIYKNNVIKDEETVFSNYSDAEITKNINILLSREPEKENAGNTYFKKDVRIRTILEDILRYVENVKKQKRCGESSESCVRFIRNNIQEGKKLDENIFSGLEEPLIMWGKKNSSLEVDFSWESIFQKYHLDILSNDPFLINSAVSSRDIAIINMIQSSQNPTYEMWLYLTFILSREKKGSPYSLKIMTEMVRLGELLKNDSDHKDVIVQESNRALANLRKVLEETYFDKKDNYLFVLKENLKDDKGQKIDTLVFVNDLNQLISEIDKSTLFLEYPDFRILRRHLSWFTCIFLKNKEYIADIRVCRGEL